MVEYTRKRKKERIKRKIKIERVQERERKGMRGTKEWRKR